MKFYLSVLLFFVLVLVSAQKVHKVEPKETIYSLARDYGISQEELVQANPYLLERGLQIGDELIIPNAGTTSNESSTTVIEVIDDPENFQQTPVVKPEDSNYYYITIEPKETLYNLSKKYKVSIDEIKSVNPSLNEGLKIGDVIRIPKGKAQSPPGYHKIQKGETLYSISRKYNISIDEILLLNRDIQINDIPVDTYIKIPSGAQVAVVDNEIDNGVDVDDDFSVVTGSSEPGIPIKNGSYQYTVKQGDTVFSILNKYDITLEEFVNANPNIKSGVNAGDVINIPLKSSDKFVKETVTEPTHIKDDTIRLGIFLPFYFNNSSKKGQREFSTLFLSGSKLALDSLAAQGKKIKVNVYDSSNDAKFSQIINQPELKYTDVFIGPVTKSNILEIRTKKELNNVPIVSPLLKDTNLSSEENIIFAEVDDETLADRIVEEVNKQNVNKIYILTDSRNSELAKYIKSNLSSAGSNIEIINSADYLEQNTNLVTEKVESVTAILVSENEQMAKDFINALDDMDDNNTFPYSVFYLDLFDVQDNKTILSNKNFAYVTSRKVNEGGYNERKTIQQYKKDYCQNPDKYAVIGFDITYDILSRFKKGSDYSDYMTTETNQLASKFDYEKLPSNSYENVGVRLIRFNKN